MPQTEIVDVMVQNSPFLNLILMAEQAMPHNANAIVDAFYGGEIGIDYATELLCEIVF